MKTSSIQNNSFFTFNWKLFFLLAAGFILFTVIGTLSHEFGHYFAAKMSGIDAEIHYGYTSWGNTTPEEWNSLTPSDKNWITLGGPLQTMLTGTFGLLLILSQKRNFLQSSKLTVLQWLMVFISFFWLRQTANFAFLLIGFVLNGKYSKRGDEVRLANDWNLPELSVASLTALIGLIITTVVIFRFVPKKSRLTLLLGGLAGGLSGFYLWLELIGPILMP